MTRTRHPLPFDQLSADDFERLCLWLVRREGFEEVEHLGQVGSEQGRDLVARRAGKRFAFQCKRVRQFGPKAAEKEIEKLGSLAAEERPDEIVFVVTRPMSAQARKHAGEVWGDENAVHYWTGTELDERVKRHPEIVSEFFGLGSREVFRGLVPRFTDDASRKLAKALETAQLRHEELVSTGGDPSPALEQILYLKRRLREGGQLKPGDYLSGDRFRLLEPLGRGGFATVFKAYDRQTRQLVAVKVLHGQYAQDRSRRERFFRGARKMAQLQHQGVVRVIEPDQEESGYHFFVMEFVDGGDLRRAVLDGRLVGVSGVQRLREVARALDFAHRQNIIHRDIKPANILLTSKAETKLTDFDLVGALDTTGGTRTGSMLGSFLYAAPEAMMQAKDLDGRGDVYSLAMTMVFVLAGQELPPTVLRDLPQYLEDLEAPDALKQELIVATSWQREDRHVSVRELWGAVEAEWTGNARERSAEPPQPTALGPEVSQSSEVTSTKPVEAMIATLAEDHDVNLDIETRNTVEKTTTGIPSNSRPKLASSRDDATTAHAGPPNEVWIDPVVGMRFRRVMPGTFQMGESMNLDETKHEVTLTRGFWIGETAVTQSEWQAIFDKNPSEFVSDNEHLPVENVTWFDVVAFANALSERAGLKTLYELVDGNGLPPGEGFECRLVRLRELDLPGYRLPTEAEWEYAARAGITSDYLTDPNLTTHQANFRNGKDFRRKTVPVRTFAANAWGLYEVLGNVWEWVWDWYDPEYPASPVTDPIGTDWSGARVFRGGAWTSRPRSCRSSQRGRNAPGDRYHSHGFRLVRTAE